MKSRSEIRRIAHQDPAALAEKYIELWERLRSAEDALKACNRAFSILWDDPEEDRPNYVMKTRNHLKAVQNDK